MRLVFAGTPEFAVAILDALVAARHDIACVYCQPDRPAGRGRKVASGPIKRRALDLGLSVAQPVTLRTPQAPAALAALEPEAMVVAAYGLLLPRSILAIPRLGCINVHASLLPRWRGAAPIQRAIAAGDAETGVSIMQMDAGMDTGPVLSSARCSIGPDDTAGDLHDRLAALGASTLCEVLGRLAQGPLPASPQADDLALAAPRIDKAEARIDWRLGAVEIERRVRAFNPWPVAFTELADGSRLRIWRAGIAAGHAQPVDSAAGAGPPGSVVDAARGCLRVATGAGTLDLLEVQAAGTRRMTAAEFLNARPIAPGTRLGPA